MNTNKLKSKRVEQGLTQESMGKNIGMTTKTYNLKENGQSLFNLDELKKIVCILKLKPNEVYEIFLKNWLRISNYKAFFKNKTVTKAT